MNIIKARNIANDVGNVLLTNDDRRRAFHRLDKSADDGNAADRSLARQIWDYFGNRAVKGKDTA